MVGVLGGRGDQGAPRDPKERAALRRAQRPGRRPVLVKPPAQPREHRVERPIGQPGRNPARMRRLMIGNGSWQLAALARNATGTGVMATVADQVKATFRMK
jgi:hypothetical protein